MRRAPSGWASEEGGRAGRPGRAGANAAATALGWRGKAGLGARAPSAPQVLAAAELPLADLLQRGRLRGKWGLREGPSSGSLRMGSVRAAFAWYPAPSGAQ